MFLTLKYHSKMSNPPTEQYTCQFGDAKPCSTFEMINVVYKMLYIGSKKLNLAHRFAHDQFYIRKINHLKLVGVEVA